MLLALATRNLLRRKSRTILSAIGIILGVAMIISLVSVAQGLRNSAESFANQIGNNIVISQANNFGPPMTSSLDESLVEEIEKIPGARVVSPVVIVPVKTRDKTGRKGFFASENQLGLVGVDASRESQASSDYTKIAAGRFLRRDDKERVVLGATVAANLGKRVGDDLEFKQRGREFSFEIVGIYETGDEEADQDVVTTLAEARRVGDIPKTRVNLITVVPSNPGQSEALERKIKLLIPGVDPSYGRTYANLLSTFTGTLQIATWVIAGIAAFIGGIGIMNTMVMSVIEQTKEIGVLRACGWKRGDILLIILAESVGISLVGGILGGVLGIVVTLWILPAIFKGVLSPVVTPLIVSQAFFFALALGIFGGFLPAKRASDLDPVEAFRNEE